MNETDLLDAPFEVHRTHMRSVAYRMLGSPSEADDAVQEAWLRLSRSDTSDVENLGGWLTTVVARVCLDMLRSRASRREEPIGASVLEPLATEHGIESEREILLGESVGLALLVVLETLGPAERLAFVLHDMFDLPFDQIAPIVGRSVEATRQLASRARRRVRGGSAAAAADRDRQRVIVDAFLAASRDGDFDALLALLDPDVVLRADGAAVLAGATAEVRGARAVAEAFRRRARAAQLALVDGNVGAVWAVGGKARVVFAFTIVGEAITSIELLADAARLDALELLVLGRKAP